MAIYRLKTKYNEAVDFLGTTEEKNLYAEIHTGTNIISVYDHDGRQVFIIDDTLENNFHDALFRLMVDPENKKVTHTEGFPFDTVLTKATK